MKELLQIFVQPEVDEITDILGYRERLCQNAQIMSGETSFPFNFDRIGVSHADLIQTLTGDS